MTTTMLTGPRSEGYRRSLIYLCYGGSCHIEEAKFSILSLMRKCRDLEKKYCVVVYTDDPEAFSGYPVNIELLSQERLASWMGGRDYIHRRKLMTVIHALEKSDGPVAFIDSDTWFKRTPDRIFDRIGPGKTCLHLSEGRINEVPELDGWPQLVENEKLVISREEMKIPVNARMWNSGVIGIHPSDAALLRTALDIVDQMSDKYKKYCTASQKFHTIEQMAIGYIFEKYSRISTTNDIVFHYWRDYLKKPFLNMLNNTMTYIESLPMVERPRASYKFRPRPNILRGIKIFIKDMAQDLGFARGKLRASA